MLLYLTLSVGDLEDVNSRAPLSSKGKEKRVKVFKKGGNLLTMSNIIIREPILQGVIKRVGAS